MKNTTTPSHDPERVRVQVGIPATPEQKQIPVVVHDMQSRRCKYQHAPRDQLAAMNGDKLGEWSAIWSESRQTWTLVEYLGDMRSKKEAARWDTWARR